MKPDLVELAWLVGAASCACVLLGAAVHDHGSTWWVWAVVAGLVFSGVMSWRIWRLR